MQTFVNRIAEYIIENELPLENVQVIVPSQRMVSYVQRALFVYDNKPKLAPKIQTIDAWMNSLIEEPVIEKSQLLFELYEIFKKNPIEQEVNSFDSFLNWAQILLSDFDEIDRYLIDPKQLFKNLKDVKEIEMWSFNSEELSLGQQKFMAFWDKLGPYYLALKEELAKHNFITKGAVYRKVATDIDRVFKRNKQSVFVFAGFNAMSESELSIIKQLHKMGRAHVLMDSDAFYLNDPLHEAGSFQRVLLEKLELKSLPFVLNTLVDKPLKMDVIECAQMTGQANVIGSKLSELSEKELNETLVLLADESLLPTLLQHLPASIGKANITLGLPLRNTSLRLWVDLIFRLQESFLRRGYKTVYYKDYIQFVHHPFILGLLSKAELQLIRQLETKIVANNWHFLQRDDLNTSEVLTKVNDLLFLPWKNDWTLAMRTIAELNRFLDDALPEKNTLEKASIRTFSEALIPLENTLLNGYPEMNLGTFKNLFGQQWSGESLAYFGNPLDGVQIMGLLETRGLDFKRLLVIGLNEGTMPPSNPIRTIIPMDLRSFYGLPTPREKQGLFAHHFYRLLHCAEEITVTYTSADEAIGSNEPSRFIQQLSLELAVINPNFQLNKQYYTLGDEELVAENCVEKTTEITKRLDNLLEKGLTFSKLDSYLKCPLDFYYRYVLRMGEENKVEEEVESSTLGTIIHEVLELLFSDFAEVKEGEKVVRLARVITIEDLNAMKKRIPLLVSEAFQTHFTEDARLLETGTNHINFVMASEIVGKILAHEMKKMNEEPHAALFVKSLEAELETQLELTIGGEPKKIKLEGIVDRIDTWNGETRIIDYKSGSLEAKKVRTNAKDLSEIGPRIIRDKRKGETNYSLQLMIYTYLYQKNTGQTPKQTGIFSFLNISESPFYLNIDCMEPGEDISVALEDTLQLILEEMYDTDTPFKHHPKAKYCQFCKVDE